LTRSVFGSFIRHFLASSGPSHISYIIFPQLYQDRFVVENICLILLRHIRFFNIHGLYFLKFFLIV
jgi:hypothetical protein